MSTILIYESPHFVLRFNQAEQWIYSEWIGEPTCESIIFNCNKLVEAVKRYSCNKVLNDNRRLSGNWLDSIDWLEKGCIPNLFMDGCEFFAWIHSPCLASRFSIQETLKLDFRNINVLIFDEIETAKSWLREN